MQLKKGSCPLIGRLDHILNEFFIDYSFLFHELTLR